MGSNRTYLRVLLFVCVAAGPTLLACEAALDFDRNKIQHYSSDDGAVQPTPEADPGEEQEDPDAGQGTPDSGGTPDAGPKDAGADADAGN